MQYNKPFDQSDLNAPYVNGDPSVGRKGSIPPAEAFETPQREIVHVIEAAGMVPSNSDLYQLLKAIKFFGGNIKQGIDIGTKNFVQVTLDPVVTTYDKLFCMVQKIAMANDAAMTFSANGLPTKPLNDATGAALSDGALPGSTVFLAMYDGTQMRVLGGQTTYNSITGLTANGGEVIDVASVSGTAVISANFEKPTHDTNFNAADVFVRKIHDGGAHVKFTLQELIDWISGHMTFPGGEDPIYFNSGLYKIKRATTTQIGVARKATSAEVAAGVAVVDNPYVGPEDVNRSAYGVGSVWSCKQFNSNGYPVIANIAGLASSQGGYVTGAQLKAIFASYLGGEVGGAPGFSGPLDLAAIDNAWRFKPLFSGTIESYVPGYVGDVGPNRVMSTIVDLRRIL